MERYLSPIVRVVCALLVLYCTVRWAFTDHVFYPLAAIFALQCMTLELVYGLYNRR